MLKKRTQKKIKFGLGRLLKIKEDHQQAKDNRPRSSCLTRNGRVSIIGLATLCASLWPGLTAVAGVPNGTWLSQPQIRFHSSTNTLSHVMRDIQQQNYKVVFLDFRGVSDEVQQRVSQEAREQKLIPVVWVQSPQYRSLTVADLIHEARHADGIQVDDHFFANYSQNDFQSLSFQYNKQIFCSIQPFQAKLVSKVRCNQLDVQCYTSNNFRNCLALADRLKAVVSLFDPKTFRYRKELGKRRFNVFLWPYSQRSWEASSQEPFGVGELLSRSFSLLQLPRQRARKFSIDDSYITLDKSQEISFSKYPTF